MEPYEFYKNPLKNLEKIKESRKRLTELINRRREVGFSNFYLLPYIRKLAEYDSVVRDAEDILPILKQLKKGMDIEQVKKLLQKSERWDWYDDDYDGDLAKVRGPIDLYIIFKDGKLVKWYF